MNEPIGLEVSRGTFDHHSSALVDGATRVTEQEVHQRLALWLAEVAVEAALAPLQPLERPDESANPGSSPE